MLVDQPALTTLSSALASASRRSKGIAFKQGGGGVTHFLQ